MPAVIAVIAALLFLVCLCLALAFVPGIIHF